MGATFGTEPVSHEVCEDCLFAVFPLVQLHGCPRLRYAPYRLQPVYELFPGTMNATWVTQDGTAMQFVGRIRDIVFLDFEGFLRAQSSERFEAAILPVLTTSSCGW